MDAKIEKRIQELVKEEISIVPYNPNWPRMFEDEADFLRAKLPKNLVKRIEHFGSTAVPGLSAKPIIDILVETTSLEETKKQIVPILIAEGYEYFWRPAIGDQPPYYAWFIKRGAQGQRTHHIHMVESDSELWDRLYFRDYLRQFPEEARRYDELKRDLSNKYSHDRVKYTVAKSDYIQTVTEKAKKYYQNLN
ncbi:MAG: GrpB family protein [Patescibacteria group bacterium]|nr:GrpB family protein [Patescibacteria group bacterium]